jgi:hypothetical protein
MGVQRQWAVLLDPPPLLEVLAEVFGTVDFVASPDGSPNGSFSHGDFVLPGATEFQHLHSDGAARQDGMYRDVKLGTRTDGSTHWIELHGNEADATNYRVVNYRELPVSHIGVTVNFPMEVGAHYGHGGGGQTAANGATRLVAGTQHSLAPIPLYSQEQTEGKLGAMIAPLPAGCAVIRDIRAWHGGCPNLTKNVRAIPGCGYHAPHLGPPLPPRGDPPTRPPVRLARQVLTTLSRRGQAICAGLVDDDDDDDDAGEVERGGGWQPPRWGAKHTEDGFQNQATTTLPPPDALARL